MILKSVAIEKINLQQKIKRRRRTRRWRFKRWRYLDFTGDSSQSRLVHVGSWEHRAELRLLPLQIVRDGLHPPFQKLNFGVHFLLHGLDALSLVQLFPLLLNLQYVRNDTREKIHFQKTNAQAHFFILFDLYLAKAFLQRLEFSLGIIQLLFLNPFNVILQTSGPNESALNEMQKKRGQMILSQPDGTPTSEPFGMQFLIFFSFSRIWSLTFNRSLARRLLSSKMGRSSFSFSFWLILMSLICLWKMKTKEATTGSNLLDMSQTQLFHMWRKTLLA